MTDIARLREIHAGILKAERELCGLEGRPFVRPLENSWNFGEEHCLLSAPFRNLLILEDLNTQKAVALAFHRVEAAMSRGLNDEVLAAHELSGSGLGATGFFVVESSDWKEDLRRRHATHSGYSAEYWASIQHFLIRFKEGEVAILAVDFEHLPQTATTVVELAAQLVEEWGKQER